MKLLINDKKDLTNFVSVIETYLKKTYLKVTHQKLKECIAKSMDFDKFASMPSAFPITVETETFVFKFMEMHDKCFSQKTDNKKFFFASHLHDTFAKDYICDDIQEVLKKAITLNEPEIFVDGGWEGGKFKYTLINDGNGQFPYIYMTKDVYKELLEKKYIGENVLITYKARKVHLFDKEKLKSIN